jgi:hypothetical protein
METLSKHFRDITRQAFARHGFAEGDVVGHWTEIVGADLARISVPERIKWPRTSAGTGRKTGGTLVVRAEPGRAIDLQYEGPRIMARINAFFGYGAITQVKVVQASASALQRPRPAPVLIDIPLHDQNLENMGESPLKDALTRLGKGVASARRSSPQGK